MPLQAPRRVADMDAVAVPFACSPPWPTGIFGNEFLQQLAGVVSAALCAFLLWDASFPDTLWPAELPCFLVHLELVRLVSKFCAISVSFLEPSQHKPSFIEFGWDEMEPQAPSSCGWLQLSDTHRIPSAKAGHCQGIQFSCRSDLLSAPPTAVAPLVSLYDSFII